MPKCRNCGRNIPKADKDICRHCGERNPFNIHEAVTQDITKFIDYDESLRVSFKRKSVKVYSFLLMFLGIFGAHFFYVNKKIQAVIAIVLNLVFIGGVGALFLLTGFASSAVYVYWIISFAIAFIIYVVMGVYCLFKGEVVDADGQRLDR